jgi:hypothetical protein
VLPDCNEADRAEVKIDEIFTEEDDDDVGGLTSAEAKADEVAL